MMKINGLSDKQINEYNENGYIAPIDILSLEQVKKLEKKLIMLKKNGQMKYMD